MRQFLTESLILAVAGALAGVAVAYGAMTLAAAVMPETGIVLRSQTFGLTRVGMNLVDLDTTTLLFTVVVAAGTALLVGILPAWQASRANVLQGIKVSGSGSSLTASGD